MSLSVVVVVSIQEETSGGYVDAAALPLPALIWALHVKFETNESVKCGWYFFYDPSFSLASLEHDPNDSNGAEAEAKARLSIQSFIRARRQT